MPDNLSNCNRTWGGGGRGCSDPPPSAKYLISSKCVLIPTIFCPAAGFCFIACPYLGPTDGSKKRLGTWISPVFFCGYFVGYGRTLFKMLQLVSTMLCAQSGFSSSGTDLVLGVTMPAPVPAAPTARYAGRGVHYVAYGACSERDNKVILIRCPSVEQRQHCASTRPRSRTFAGSIAMQPCLRSSRSPRRDVQQAGYRGNALAEIPVGEAAHQQQFLAVLGQWHALQTAMCYGQPRGPVARSNVLLWPTLRTCTTRSIGTATALSTLRS